MLGRTTLTLALAATTIASTQAKGPTPKGKAVQWVGNSFHWFLAAPVAKLAKEAGIQGHRDVGNDRIGGSEPCQHWNKGGNTNTVKDNLNAGKADILTLTMREKVPDECVPKFIELANKGRKDIKVMVQETWIVQSANKDLEKCVDWGCANRDAATFEMIEQTRAQLETPYRNQIRTQITGINKQYGSNFTSMVPVYSAILSLRQLAVKGQLPGVAKQSSLFKDNLGHPQKPVSDMASYMWFAAMYNINPQGMTSLSQGTPSGQAAILQKLAWDTLKAEPLNGLA